MSGTEFSKSDEHIAGRSACHDPIAIEAERLPNRALEHLREKTLRSVVSDYSKSASIHALKKYAEDIARYDPTGQGAMALAAKAAMVGAIAVLREQMMAAYGPANGSAEPSGGGEPKGGDVDDATRRLREMLMKSPNEAREKLFAAVRKHTQEHGETDVSAPLERLVRGEEVADEELEKLLDAFYADDDLLLLFAQFVDEIGLATPEIRQALHEAHCRCDDVRCRICVDLDECCREHSRFLEKFRTVAAEHRAEYEARPGAAEIFKPEIVALLLEVEDEDRRDDKIKEAVFLEFVAAMCHDAKLHAERRESEQISSELDRFHRNKMWEAVIQYVAACGECLNDPAAQSRIQRDFSYPPGSWMLASLREFVQKRRDALAAQMAQAIAA